LKKSRHRGRNEYIFAIVIASNPRETYIGLTERSK